MFVTRLSLRGITQVAGTWNIHAALMLTIILYYPTSESQIDENEDQHSSNQSQKMLYRLMLITHASIWASQLCTGFNLFEGML